MRTMSVCLGCPSTVENATVLWSELSSVECQGPRTVYQDGPIPEGYSVVAYAPVGDAAMAA
ncbi:hypothetical protein ACFVX3_19325 [Rhodococcus erythropolis]